MVSNRMFLLFLYLLICSMFLNFFSEILDSSSLFLPFDIPLGAHKNHHKKTKKNTMGPIFGEKKKKKRSKGRKRKGNPPPLRTRFSSNGKSWVNKRPFMYQLFHEESQLILGGTEIKTSAIFFTKTSPSEN